MNRFDRSMEQIVGVVIRVVAVALFLAACAPFGRLVYIAFS